MAEKLIKHAATVFFTVFLITAAAFLIWWPNEPGTAEAAGTTGVDGVPAGVIAAVDADECPAGWRRMTSRDGFPLFTAMPMLTIEHGEIPATDGNRGTVTRLYPACAKEPADTAEPNIR